MTVPPAAQPASVAPAPRHVAPGPGRPEGPPIAAAAEIRPRHHGILASFLGLVLLPVLVSAAYLWLVAQDQYASTLGFSVRTEEISSSLDLLGGITRLSGGGSSDSDILYDYIHSQELVGDLDAQIGLRGIYARAWPRDPVFAFDPDSTIEDLVSHWERKVRITYDSNSGLMTLQVLAFTPEAATLIAEHILERSTEKINALAAEARDDATRYARIEMDRALERLKTAREAMTGFRIRTQMVDPAADLQGQMGVLNNLQAQLAESYIELDLLRVTTNSTDPRIIQAEQRIVVIRNRIEEERRKFSESENIPGGEDYATMVSEFERLTVDREFAEQAYSVALASYDSALAEAQRKSRYLAAHIRPTQAEKSEYPQRWTLLGLTGFFLFAAWAIAVLIFYSIRDRR
ncbi:sugar transporter [Szabonella alba]|uniref:sugar transporter n=1 Tax=Szabonella alba TaxID=2804194 RepID=UPI001F2592EA|nr:sugar transporter [Szabonella alba]